MQVINVFLTLYGEHLQNNFEEIYNLVLLINQKCKN